MKFLTDMVYKGKLFRKKKNKTEYEENIIQLDLKGKNLGPMNIKYITEFNLKNLRTLDLSKNSIKSEGALFLSQGKFNSLESLNLNNNKIGDEGLNHISKGIFVCLTKLYLSHNNISYERIKYLIYAKFTNNLVILDLSENQKIGDTGIKCIKDNNKWENLRTLNIDNTGLTDDSLCYIIKASMPKLKQLNIKGNKFTAAAIESINNLRKNNIDISYATEDEFKKDKK